MTIWSILRRSVKFLGNRVHFIAIFPVLVCCPKKNLATLLIARSSGIDSLHIYIIIFNINKKLRNLRRHVHSHEAKKLTRQQKVQRPELCYCTV
jgi:hypothetical protein